MVAGTSDKSRRWADRWRRRWDLQQERYLPDREERFTAILDVLEHSVATAPRSTHHRADRAFRFLDVGCGTGALSERVLNRFPRAKGVGVDFDPVLMRLGRCALDRFDDRLDWVEADLREPEWWSRLPVQRFDAALSTTALHWLARSDLRRLYADLHRLLRPGGVFLNGDTLGFPTSARLARRWAHVHRGVDLAHSSGRGEGWREWWDAVLADPRLEEEAKLREERVPRHHERVPRVDLDAHRRLLGIAGFRETEVVWSHWENRLLLAVR
jgi:SAM-dependent methyltransferase